MTAFLLLQGIETLPLRMERHIDNTVALVKHLEAHDKVAWVRHASTPGNPNFDVAKKYTPKGAGSVLTFGIKSGQEAALRFTENVKLCSHLANVGDAKTLVLYPAATSHQQLTDEERLAAGIPPDLIRVSVGIEHIDDIIWDIDQALAKA